MRPKRKIRYIVSPDKDWWWCQKKWVRSDDIKGRHASSCKVCRTFDQAMKIAGRVPSGQVRVTQYVRGRGSRDYYYRKEEK